MNSWIPTSTLLLLFFVVVSPSRVCLLLVCCGSSASQLVSEVLLLKQSRYLSWELFCGYFHVCLLFCCPPVCHQKPKHLKCKISLRTHL